MARKGFYIEDQRALHFVTFTLVYWVDLFSKTAYSEIVLENFRHYRSKQGLRIHGYVIMSNHIHAILSATEPRYDLSSIIGNLKRYCANCFIELLQNEHDSRAWWMLKMFAHAASNHERNKKFQVWTHQNHPVQLDDATIIEQKLDYIHENPVKAGLVSEPEHWRYSSASNYARQLSVFKTDLIEEFVWDK